MQYNRYPLVSDNKYFDRPARMNDGRALSDWRSAGFTNNVIRMQYGLYDDNDYRAFLQHNAEYLMHENKEYYRNMSACDRWAIIPPLKTCNVNTDYMLCKMTNPNGVGVKYQAYNS